WSPVASASASPRGPKPGGLTPRRRGSRGLGACCVSKLNPQKGRVVATPNMNLSDTQIVARLEARFGVPVALGNDTDLGTLGETWLGAARGARSAFGIFVGTGDGNDVRLREDAEAGASSHAMRRSGRPPDRRAPHLRLRGFFPPTVDPDGTAGHNHTRNDRQEAPPRAIPRTASHPEA
ncbi:MAG: ROK family protein, partial [Phycisphaerae bacterium]